VKQFLVEVFAPQSQAGELSAAERRARAATKRVTREAARVRYLRAIYVPEDETCFYVFEASSADLVAQASALAGLGAGRIVEACQPRKESS
jgi:CRISPR/Cas system Type II protein with McrA/HNH and RuvC-like nuclease domain